MDYGHLAYMKAEEIENYLRMRAASAEKRNSLSASFYPRCEISGGYEPCTLSGSGNIGVVAAVSVRAPHSVSGVRIMLYLGGKIAAYTSVTLGAGESARYMLLASVNPDGDGEKMRLSSSASGLVLEELHILVEGADASVGMAGERIKCDYSGERVYLMREEDGYIKLCEYGGNEVNVAHGSTYDLAVNENGVNVLCADDVGNLWGVQYSTELEELSRVNLGDAPSRIAVGLGLNGLTIAGVFGNEIKTCECEEGFVGKSDWVRLDLGVPADEVYLCKQTPVPPLIVQSGKSLYAKLPLPASSTRDTVRVKVSFVNGRNSALLSER